MIRAFPLLSAPICSRPSTSKPGKRNYDATNIQTLPYRPFRIASPIKHDRLALASTSDHVLDLACLPCSGVMLQINGTLKQVSFSDTLKRAADSTSWRMKRRSISGSSRAGECLSGYWRLCLLQFCKGCAEVSSLYEKTRYP